MGVGATSGRWDSSELERLALAEIAIGPVRHYNVQLESLLTGWSREQIKNRRKQLDYKALLLKLQSETNANDVVEDSSEAHPPEAHESGTSYPDTLEGEIFPRWTWQSVCGGLLGH
jgi:hypothetical protein